MVVILVAWVVLVEVLLEVLVKTILLVLHLMVVQVEVAHLEDQVVQVFLMGQMDLQVLAVLVVTLHHLVLMAVAVGASCAFLTPIGHQCNAMILGPGGYRFGDYWRVGLPLEIVIAILGTPLIVQFWPL